jgi:hypothetical protein
VKILWRNHGVKIGKEISENKKSHAMRDFYYIIFINYFASK